jgi:hypothetical protein
MPAVDEYTLLIDEKLYQAISAKEDGLPFEIVIMGCDTRPPHAHLRDLADGEKDVGQFEFPDEETPESLSDIKDYGMGVSDEWREIIFRWCKAPNAKYPDRTNYDWLWDVWITNEITFTYISVKRDRLPFCIGVQNPDYVDTPHAYILDLETGKRQLGQFEIPLERMPQQPADIKDYKQGISDEWRELILQWFKNRNVRLWEIIHEFKNNECDDWQEEIREITNWEALCREWLSQEHNMEMYLLRGYRYYLPT